MKEALCRAFCDGVEVRTVPAGLAVRTPFARRDGDLIGFYIRETADGLRIEDSGVILPLLEAEGLDFRSGSRRDAMTELLGEYSVTLDADDRLFSSLVTDKADLASAALRFVAFCLRVSDFSLMTEARAASTFRDDVRKLLSEAAGPRALVAENEVIAPGLSDFPADFVLRATGRPPVGVYLATSDARVLEATLVQMRAEYETHEACSVIALIEKAKSISAVVRRNAGNRLAALGEFRGDEVASIQRIVHEAVGQTYH